MPERTEMKRKPCISCNMFIHALLFSHIYVTMKTRYENYIYERKSGASLISQSFLGMLQRT